MIEMSGAAAPGAWRRLGQLELDTTAAASWARTHAALPIAVPRGDRTWDVYLSLRDDQGRSRIGRTILRLDPRPALAPLDPSPVVDLGPLGAFDDSGVTSSCLVRQQGRTYLFYTGWSLGVTVPFYLAAGVAVSEHGRPFERPSPAPLLDRAAVDPFLSASPYVFVDEGRWRMWYISGTSWERGPDGPRHRYHVKYAESNDGLQWDRSGIVCVDYADEGEHAFGRPCVVRDADVYRMWYASRGDRYVIGYAESHDGVLWQRLDAKRGLMPATTGWDSEMVEYPFVFDADGRRYMLYNGNGYGRTGVGLAAWETASK